MSIFGKNIRKIRAIKKLSQTSFADLFHLTRATVGAYEEGRAEPRIETIINISRFYSISADALISKELTVNEILHFDALTDDKKKNSIKPEINEKRTTPFVALKYQVEYTLNTENIEFLSKLPVIRLPYDGEFITRAFEHDGCDMHIKHTGIHHGDILFCKKINHKEPLNIYEQKIYVLVLKNRLFVKRILQKGPVLICDSQSENNQLNILFTDIIEMWEIIGIYSTHLFMPDDLTLRLLRLEEKVFGISKSQDNKKSEINPSSLQT